MARGAGVCDGCPMRLRRAGRDRGVRRHAPRGVPAPVVPRRLWGVSATIAVTGTIAAALAPSPWSIICGVLAAFGAVGAFGFFVAIVVLEDRDRDR
jgi:hypothetical protein